MHRLDVLRQPPPGSAPAPARPVVHPARRQDDKARVVGDQMQAPTADISDRVPALPADHEPGLAVHRDMAAERRWCSVPVPACSRRQLTARINGILGRQLAMTGTLPHRAEWPSWLPRSRAACASGASGTGRNGVRPRRQPEIRSRRDVGTGRLPYGMERWWR